jgi:hypothetical protein
MNSVRLAVKPWMMIPAIALSLQSCGFLPQPQKPNDENLSTHTYPKEVVQQFTRGCQENTPKDIKPDLAEKICTCAIAQIQQKYTLGEFKTLGDELRKTGQPPQEIREMLKGCAEKSVPKK